MKKTWLKVLYILLLLISSSQVALAEQVVKVGYPLTPGFYERDEQGNLSGYGVQYLNKLANYTGWHYEYIEMETISELMESLQKGEVDIVAGYSRKRALVNDLLTSELPMGNTNNILVTRADNEALAYNEFPEFNNLQIGVLTDGSLADEFKLYMKENYFSARLYKASSFVELHEKLKAGEIDAFVGRVWHKHDNEKVIGQFAPTPYYLLIKDDPILKAEIDEAMSNISIKTPNFEQELHKKYFHRVVAATFTRSELNFIKDKQTISIGCLSQNAPLSYFNAETMEMEGIIPHILKLAADKVGVNIKLLPIRGEPIPFLKKEQVDFVAGVLNADINLADKDIVLSPHILENNLVLLMRENNNQIKGKKVLKIAVKKDFRGGRDYLLNTYPEYKIILCDTIEECLELVQKGAADAALQEGYVAGDWLKRPGYENLILAPQASIVTQICLAGRSSVADTKFSLLEKALRSVSNEEKNQIILAYTIAQKYDYTFSDLIKKYRIPMGYFLFLGVIVLWSLWKRWEEHQKNLSFIAANEEKLRHITNNINGGILTLQQDQKLTISYANEGFLTLVGYNRKEYEAKPQELIEYIYEADLPLFWQEFARQIVSGRIEIEVRLVCKTGSDIFILLRGTLDSDEKGEKLLFCVITDITEQKNILQALQREKERYSLIIENSNDIIFDIDFAKHQFVCASSFAKVFQWQPSTDLRDIVYSREHVVEEDYPVLEKIRQQMRAKGKSITAKLRILKADGHYIWMKISLLRVSNVDEPQKYLGRLLNIDRQMRENEALRLQSQTDALTELLNKATFEIMVKAQLAKDEVVEGALFFIDLDNFKTLNDTLGHLSGDEALRDFSDKLRQCFRSDDLLGRFGGDEFCAFVANLPAAIVRKKAQELAKALNKEYGNGTKKVNLSASIGVALFNVQMRDYDKLLEQADQALYDVKSNGREGYRVFAAKDK